VRAIEPRLGRQACQPLERPVHLLRTALEQPAAAHGEQSVADERHAVLVEDQGDVAERVAGDFDDAANMLAEPDPVALAKRHVAAGDVLVGRPGDASTGGFLDGQVASSVIWMPVGVPHLADRPTALLSGGKYRRRVARIDHRRLTTRIVVDEPKIIVGEGGDRDDVEHHHTPLFGIDVQGSAGASAAPF